MPHNNLFESRSPLSGLSLRDSVRQLKKSFKFLPVGLYTITLYGGYISPRGEYFINIAKNYNDATLKRAYCYVPPQYKKRITLQDYALFKGWIEIDYYQSYGMSAVNFSPNIKRRIIFKFYPKKALHDPKLFFRLLMLVRFYENLFDYKIDFVLQPVEFLNLKEEGLVKSFKKNRLLLKSSKAVDLKLQLLRSELFNKNADIYADVNKPIYEFLMQKFMRVPS